ncbi:hypothetical protein AXG93_3354s1040 [Marchantia polymorpha subsp. ruderalis]|uniref:Uncharacterized protein n=1 Tax=Marchantia polymorpha subsp. ruderalis TaxID=1480154 RepID=A0A176VEI7_MARPO|nr:hypothetical protein AXG93_3354s1040 [Marchantia polymorpha subsp. ruderalis]
MEVPSGVLIEVPANAPAEPLKKETEIVSPNSLSSERTRSAGSEEIPHSKTSEELVKELTLSDEILEQVVAQVRGTVVEATYITLPSSCRRCETRRRDKDFGGGTVRLVRNSTKLKRVVAVLREWDSATKLARERAANLSTECAAVKATLQEREA